MERTGLSIAGGILLILASILTGIGGIGFAVAGHADKLMKYAAEHSEQFTPEQQQQFEEARKKFESDPEAKKMLPKLKSYGYFEIAAALVGFIGGIGMLTATAFGKTAGALGAVLGLVTCLWALALFGVGAVIVQSIFLILYVLALAGAMSLKPREAAGAFQ